MAGKDLNKQALKNLIPQQVPWTGMGYTRRRWSSLTSRPWTPPANYARIHEGGQMNLFVSASLEEPEAEIRRLGEYPFGEKLRDEYEALGFYLSGHPLDAYQGLLPG